MLLLQHGDIETNPGPTKEKIKNLSFCHWNINSLIARNLTKISHLEAYNAIYKHDFICISEIFFDFSVKEGDKNIQLNGYNMIGQTILVIQNEVEFVSSTKKHWLFTLLTR